MRFTRYQIVPWFTAITACLLGGCDVPNFDVGPGHSDFSAKLVGDYSIHRSSANEIEISPDGYAPSRTPIIPTKVVECVVHDRLILAKRQGFKPRNRDNPSDTDEELDPNAFDYWILDTASPKVFGPLTAQQFTDKRHELGVPDAIGLKDIFEFRP